MAYESKYKGKQIDDAIDKIANTILVEATLNDSVDGIGYLLTENLLIDDQVTNFKCTDTRFNSFIDILDYFLLNINEIKNNVLFQITLKNSSFKISSLFQITWSTEIMSTHDNGIVYLSGNIGGSIMIMYYTGGEVQTTGFKDDSLYIKIENKNISGSAYRLVNSFSEFLAMNYYLGNIQIRMSDLFSSFSCNIPGVDNFENLSYYLNNNSYLNIKQANLIFKVGSNEQMLNCSICRETTAFGFSFTEGDSYNGNLYATYFGESDDGSDVYIRVQKLGDDYIRDLGFTNFTTLEKACIFNHSIKAKFDNGSGTAFKNINVVRSQMLFDGYNWNTPTRTENMTEVDRGLVILTPIQIKTENVWVGSSQKQLKVVRGTVQITAMTADNESIIGQGSFSIAESQNLELTIQTTTFYS